MALTHMERAMLTDRPPKYALLHDLRISGEDWSDRLLDATMTWTAEGAGGSNLDFNVDGSLEHLSDAPVSFSMGYGRDDVKRYFKGRLMMPKDHETLPQASGVAFGPFRLLTDTFLRNTMTYQGRTLEYVLMDLSRRAEYRTGEFVVLGGRRFRVPAGEIYAMGTALQEVAASVLDAAKFVAFDAPGGRRIIMPTPKPGSNGSVKAVYTPDNYKTFSTEPAHEVAYHSVVVYRHEGSTWGGGTVYAERAVDAPVIHKPARSRVYYVSDYPGTQGQAADEAARLALALRNGEKTFSMTAPFNRELALYDGFRCIRIKNLGAGVHKREVYICTIKEMTVTYTPGGNEMTLSGTCYEVKNEQYEIDDRFAPSATSYGVVVPTAEYTIPAEDFVVPDDFTFIG